MHNNKNEKRSAVQMTNVSDLKQEQRRGAIHESPFAKSQQMIKELPAMFQGMQKQMVGLQRIMKEQVSVSQKQSDLLQNEHDLMERVHDRLDALAVESRVTNLLLAELVAVQQSVIHDDVTDEREAIRADVYNKILNGE